MLLAGGPYGLRSVHLPHPPLAPEERYPEFFGADVRFERPAAVLRVPADLASRPARRRRRDACGRSPSTTWRATSTGPGRTVTDRVRAALTRSLGTGPARIGSVARLLRMHPRTLQRHLASEGTTFETVLDEVRRGHRAPPDHPYRPAVHPGDGDGRAGRAVGADPGVAALVR